ncbi:hypothetical protein [Bacterioplanoides sp.]|uniref:hypothetical protein n=1 Tax=Bacterioplanoides sp. TaxID=2066072 RepID=UPI003B591F6A
MQLSRLALTVLIPSVMALTACSGNGSSTKSAAQPEETPPTSNDGGDGNTGGGDGNTGGGDGNNGGSDGNNGGGDGNNGGGDGNNGGGDGNTGGGDGNTGGGKPVNNDGIDGNCIYAQADYQPPQPYSLTEYLSTSLNSDTYTIRQGQEVTAADTDLTGTWLLVHNQTRKSTNSREQEIEQSQTRMVFVIREQNGQIQHSQCTAARDSSGHLLNSFVDLNKTNLNDQIDLNLFNVTLKAPLKIESNTRMVGIPIDGSGENSIVERVEYYDQFTKAVKISADTGPIGSMSLSAENGTVNHNNENVYCISQTLLTDSLAQCKNSSVFRGRTSLLTVRADSKVRFELGIGGSNQAVNDLILFRYDEGDSELNSDTIREQIYSDTTQNISKINMNIGKSLITGTMTISGQLGSDSNTIDATANTSLNVVIPLQIP